MSDRPPHLRFQDVIAGLRLELRDAYRNGLGQESVPREADDMIEEAMKSVFELHARVTMAGALGLTPWLVAEITQAWPEPTWGEEDGCA